MSVIVSRFWTLKRIERNVTLKQYKTRTMLRGDEASHIDCVIAQQFEMPIEDLPTFMVECDIDEFTDEETASWMLEAPKGA